MPTEKFDLEASKNYWKYAPSGLGKINSEELLLEKDDEFLSRWRAHFDSRLTHYREERHFTDILAERWAGQRVLSFGSGLGLNESRFLEGGCEVTCADIVPANLEVIRRSSQLSGWGDRTQLLLIDEDPPGDFGGPFDMIYAWGSLMTMPRDQQRIVLDRFKQALAPHGELVLLLYTETFLKMTTPTDSNRDFALASDPSVVDPELGELHCPWSDWHNDEVLLELVGEELEIVEKQYWNQDFYVTYTLKHCGAGGRRPSEEAVPYFDLRECEERATSLLVRYKPEVFSPAEAQLSVESDSLHVTTGENEYLYAALSPTVELDARAYQEIVLLVDSELIEGGWAFGILDLDTNRFSVSRSVRSPGRRVDAFAWPATDMPRRSQLVLSNFFPGGGKSRIHFYDMNLRARY